MADEAYIELGYFRGPLDRVLAALEVAHFDGALLELDGGESAELEAFIDEATRDRPELNEAYRRARRNEFRLGPITFRRAHPLVVPIGADNLARLREIAARHADPEIAMHVHVKDGDGYLLEAWDVGDNVILVSNRLPEPTQHALRRTLGKYLTPI